jgi:hypothetical protein
MISNRKHKKRLYFVSFININRFFTVTSVSEAETHCVDLAQNDATPTQATHFYSYSHRKNYG